MQKAFDIKHRKDYYSYDDGVFAALKLLEYLAGEKQTFSEILKTTPQYVSSPTWQVDCADDVKYDVVEKLVKEFKEEFDAEDTDICKFLTNVSNKTVSTKCDD